MAPHSFKAGAARREPAIQSHRIGSPGPTVSSGPSARSGHTVGLRPAASSRRTVLTATLAVLALVIGAVLWPGYDSVDTPRRNVNIWALNNSSSYYGQMNTAIREVESIASAANVSTVLQTPDSVLVFTDGNHYFAEVDEASPVDLSQEDTSALQPTPEGTKSVSLGSSRILYVAADGRLSTASVETPAEALPLAISSHASAAVITAEDVAVALVQNSTGEQHVLRIDGFTGQILDQQDLVTPVSQDAQISQVQGKWVILDSAAKALWIEKQSKPIEVPSEAGALLRAPGEGPIIIADSRGLLEWHLDEATSTAMNGAQRTVTAPAGSVAARPTQVGDRVLAAWLTPGTSGGILWDSVGGSTSLAYGVHAQERELPGSPRPRIMVAGDDAILNDTVSGWAWTLPDGELIPTSQDWVADATPAKTSTLSQVEEVNQQRPPVAMPDSFGVRPGQQSVLPVLLNDYDANQDVLSIDPGSVTGLDRSFGRLSLTNDNQQLLVDVAEEATGSASFMYSVTDGTSADGLLSAPARVTLTVADSDQNSKPFFAGVGVQDYLGVWPSPSVAPGGTASAHVLQGWIDPQGDPLFLASATTDAENAQVLAESDGTVTVRHTDPSTESLEPIAVTVTVANTRGASESKDLVFKVHQSPPIDFVPAVVTTAVGVNLDIDLTEYVQGGQGSVSIAQVNESLESNDLRVTTSQMNLNVTAFQPGSYPLQVTLEDAMGNQAQQTIRIVALKPEDATLGAWPATVFIRPGEDTTVDLIKGISNPAGHVLLITGLDLHPEEDAELTAEVVGSRYIHASGRAAKNASDSTGATLLGTADYTVSDGSGNPAARGRGTVSFLMVENADGYPIATDRQIQVRAGAQVDIPVLEWAKAPGGAQLAIDQGSVSLTPTEGEGDVAAGLVFATANTIRYLAPTRPGEYSVGYSLFPIGAPEFSSSATLRIQVVAADNNPIRAPKLLEARAFAGATTVIVPDHFNADIQDQTYSLSTVVDQPALGTASVAPDGESLLYTAHLGATGQDSFTYEVRGSDGQTTLGTVLVGVLGAAASPLPILYSRYLQTPIGAQNRVSVFPLDNAEDSLGGELTLDQVWPNEVPGSAQFIVAEKRILSADAQTGEVLLAAADQEGTTSFFYKAHNERGDQATGLIVTKAVKTPTELLPQITDTRLTAENLRDLPSGIDVLNGKVTWASGPVSDLEMSLWDPAGDYSANGTEISGPIPLSPTIVPFKVQGTSFRGDPAQSYGFLKIPPAADVPVSLRSDLTPPEVPEGQTVAVNLLDVIVDPQDKGLVFAPDKVETSGARQQASCRIIGTDLVYAAGLGAPWEDACIIPVRAQNQETLTYLSLPIAVIPKAPQPVLLPAGAQASPGGDSVHFDLTPMVDWQGGEPGQERFAVTGSEDLFTWIQTDSILTIKADPRATPTRAQTLSVSLIDYPQVAPGVLTLTVGPAAGEAPRAGTVTASCSTEDSNTTCVFPVVGPSAAGQANYLPDVPLKLAEGSVVSPGNCPGVRFTYHDEVSVKATWEPKSPGFADCHGSFEVIDAQGRLSQGMNRGTIVFELQGVPTEPDVTWVLSQPDAVGFSVALRGQSHPKVDSVAWSSGPHTGTCSAEGMCMIPVAQSALGQEKTYTFRAVSTAGLSAGANVTAWSYRSASKVRHATWSPNADGISAMVSVEADSLDTGFLTVGTGSTSKTVYVSAATASWDTPWKKVTFDVNVPAGEPTNVQITANGRLERPPASVAVADAGSATETVRGVFAVGAPDIILEASASETGATGTVHVVKDNGAQSQFSSLEVRLCAWVDDEDKRCVDGKDLSVPAPPAAQVRFEAQAWGRPTGAEALGDTFPSVTQTQSVRVGVPAPLSGSSYRIDPAAEKCVLEGHALCYRWDRPESDPALGLLPVGGSRAFSFDSFSHVYASLASALSAQGYQPVWPTLQVRNQVGSALSAAVEVQLDGWAPRRVAVQGPPGEPCPVGINLDFSPFLYWPAKFGTQGQSSQMQGDGSVLHTWTLQLGGGLTAEGRDVITWTCIAPPPITPPPISPPSEP